MSALAYAPWKGVVMLALGFGGALAIAARGGDEADGRLGAVVFAACFILVYVWAARGDA